MESLSWINCSRYLYELYIYTRAFLPRVDISITFERYDLYTSQLATLLSCSYLHVGSHRVVSWSFHYGMVLAIPFLHPCTWVWHIRDQIHYMRRRNLSPFLSFCEDHSVVFLLLNGGKFGPPNRQHIHTNFHKYTKTLSLLTIANPILWTKFF